MVHPLVDSFLPVNYTPYEFRAQKRRLDPDGSRSSRKRNPHTTGRITQIGAVLNVDPSRIMDLLDEARDVRLAQSNAGRKSKLASPMCCEDRFAMYVTTRAVRPRIVVETGVAHGSSSAFVLAGLEANETGSLISIELSNDPSVGGMIPKELRGRWSLQRGNSLKVLPDVLAEHGPIDMFIHDSLHRCRHVTSELELVWPHLAPGGVMCVHNILANNAFPRFLKRHEAEIGDCIASVNFGLIRKRGESVSG